MTDYQELRRSTERLRELAEQATPGPWYPTENSDEFGGDIVNGEGDYIAVDREGLVGCVRNGPDVAYIAAANPATILSLLDERDHYENVAQKHVNRTRPAEQRVRELEAANADLREGLRLAIRRFELLGYEHGQPGIVQDLQSLLQIERSEADATTSVKAQPSLSERSDLSSSGGDKE